MSRGSTDVLVRGLRVLGIGIREQWRVFTLSMIGSVLFGAMTVANAWVLGWVTDQVCCRRSRTGTRPRALLAGAAALFVGVALLQGGRHRRPAARRRHHAVPHAGRVPARGHPAVPPAAAVLAPAAPHRPAAVQRQRRRRGGLVRRSRRCRWRCGTVAMMVIAVGADALTDPVLAVVGLLVFPLVIVVNVVYQRRHVAADDPGPGAARRGQRGRARVASTARWWSRPSGREGERDRAGSPPRRRRAARREHPGRPDARPCSTRSWRRCPASACSRCCWSACSGCEPATTDVGRRWSASPTCSRIAGLPDPVDRLGARRVAPRRGRLRPGAAGARAAGEP